MPPRGRTIKSFVAERIAKGHGALRIWRDAQDEFPHRCCGWGYISTVYSQLKSETHFKSDGATRKQAR
jgi:hypothetical protein